MGLARSRSDVQGDQNASKKQKTDKIGSTSRRQSRTASRSATTAPEKVSNSNVTRRKEHLLQCKSILGSQEADRAAVSDPKLKEALEKYRY